MELRNKANQSETIGKLLTVAELNHRLNLPEHSTFLYQQIFRKKLPFRFIKVGKFLRFPESEVENYLARQLQSAGN